MKQTGWLLLVGLLLVSAAQADVVVTRKTTSEGFMGMGGFESTETEYFANDRKCTVSEKKGGEPLANVPGMDGSIEITRLDKGVNWSVTPATKTYREMPLDNYKEEMKQASQGQGRNSGAMDYADKYDFSFEITDDGDKQTLNGFDCTLMRAVGTGIEKENPDSKITLSMEFWLGDDIPGFETLKTFNEGYMAATGLDQADFSPMMGDALSEFGEQYTKLFEKMKESGSYPIRTVFEITMAGQHGMPGMEDMDFGALAESVEETDDGDTSMAARMKRKAMKMMSKMKTKDKPAASATKEFSMRTVVEVTGIEETDVDASRYEVNESYTKISR